MENLHLLMGNLRLLMGNLRLRMGNLRLLMGNLRLRPRRPHTGVFKEADIEQYLKCTFLTRGEMERLYQRFSELDPEIIDPLKADVSTRLNFPHVQEMAELKENPFRQRLCEVFSTDGKGLHFDDMLDMFSVFSVRAPLQLKATYAYKIYDHDKDGIVSREDIKKTLIAITDDRLSEEEVEIVLMGVIKECDAIEGHLGFAEFEHALIRCPDFTSLFHMSI